MQEVGRVAAKIMDVIGYQVNSEETPKNKPRHATASNRSVEMTFRNYNPKPVSDFRSRY